MARDAFGREFSQGRSLTSLEKKRCGPPTYGSHLVDKCHRLRDVPVENLDVEGLRVLIGQNIGLTWLVPLAVPKLEEDPFLSGDFYRGDLLKSVLCADPAFYEKVPAVTERVRRLHALAASRVAALDGLDRPMIERVVREAPDRFKA